MVRFNTNEEAKEFDKQVEDLGCDNKYYPFGFKFQDCLLGTWNYCQDPLINGIGGYGKHFSLFPGDGGIKYFQKGTYIITELGGRSYNWENMGGPHGVLDISHLETKQDLIDLIFYEMTS